MTDLICRTPQSIMFGDAELPSDCVGNICSFLSTRDLAPIFTVNKVFLAQALKHVDQLLLALYNDHADDETFAEYVAESKLASADIITILMHPSITNVRKTYLKVLYTKYDLVSGKGEFDRLCTAAHGNIILRVLDAHCKYCPKDNLDLYIGRSGFKGIVKQERDGCEYLYSTIKCEYCYVVDCDDDINEVIKRGPAELLSYMLDYHDVIMPDFDEETEEEVYNEIIKRDFMRLFDNERRKKELYEKARLLVEFHEIDIKFVRRLKNISCKNRRLLMKILRE